MPQRIKLGVISDEFFDPQLGRMGGFGWACQQLAAVFGVDASLGVELVFLSNELKAIGKQDEVTAHNCRLILRSSHRWAWLRRLRRERFALLLAIDYNLGYRFFARAWPRVPLIVWSRDPRPPEDMAIIQTLRLPAQPSRIPQGINPLDGTSLGGVVRQSRWLRRPVRLATPAPHLAAKMAGTYNYEPPELYFLPNIINLKPHPAGKSATPLVVFLGRLDPYKRPWLFVELARRFPSAEFVMLGQAHFTGAGAWTPEDLPANVKMQGHVGETAKEELLSSAWVLVNTSLHEGLAVSFLEALACETPLLAGRDPGGVTSRFGVCVGQWNGDGLDALPLYEKGLRQLLDDAELRQRLGREGREWVNATHSRDTFLDAFARLCQSVGVDWR